MGSVEVITYLKEKTRDLVVFVEQVAVIGELAMCVVVKRSARTAR